MECHFHSIEDYFVTHRRKKVNISREGTAILILLGQIWVILKTFPKNFEPLWNILVSGRIVWIFSGQAILFFLFWLVFSYCFLLSRPRSNLYRLHPSNWTTCYRCPLSIVFLTFQLVSITSGSGCGSISIGIFSFNPRSIKIISWFQLSKQI